jgi:hypothetical protein
MKLPVLVSERCGNHWEAVVPEGNGFLFDPYDAADLRRAFEKMLAAASRWPAMGEQSGAIYDTTFRTDLVIANFMRSIDDLADSAAA